MTQFEGDTGPYLQYAHARLCSIERKSGLTFDDSYHVEHLKEKEAVDLAWHIALLPDAIQQARITHEPCTLVSYLMTLVPTSLPVLAKDVGKGTGQGRCISSTCIVQVCKDCLE